MRSSKRKVSALNDGGTVILSALQNLSDSTPRAIATALLSLLPPNATKLDPSAKKLLKAFPMVSASLDARANALARASVEEGASKPFEFRFSAVAGGTPTTNGVMVMVMADAADSGEKNDGEETDLGDDGSNQDQTTGFSNKSKHFNMKGMVELLSRRQFSNLKSLAVPNYVKLGKSGLKQIAKACPQLTSFEWGFNMISGPRPKDSDLMEVTVHFPNLTSLRTEMWNITSQGIRIAVTSMGESLLDLRIRADTISNHYLSGIDLELIAKACPNMEYFAYVVSKWGGSFTERALENVNGSGVIALVENCRKLEVLELDNAKSVGREAFETIVQMLNEGNGGGGENGRESFALREIKLEGYPYAVVNHDDEELSGGRLKWTVE
ncbi:predicted protein [Thalassiosira pseudonana CCMP1335]|uniref:Uncharacterized protein n=1 Tax=Thalassiosira pseudonana TaxID=35128 RepID=B8CF33_THAPS|nr:predicted protein [Thalassiosira pseudonana CCMP1335]EED88011.1 predicted protein [Thalassiosira pseudonana CCMP1335]